MLSSRGCLKQCACLSTDARLLLRSRTAVSSFRLASTLANVELKGTAATPDYRTSPLYLQKNSNADLSIQQLLEELNGLRDHGLLAKDDEKSGGKSDDKPDDATKDTPSTEPTEPTKPTEDQPHKEIKKKKKRDSIKKRDDSVTEGKTESTTATTGPLANANDNKAGGEDGGDGNEEPKVPSPPDIYPQVMGLPMSRRPLFPGFYRPVAITDPEVIKAVNEMLDKKTPYIGIFLFKDEQADADVIVNKDEVYDVGVFGQITSSFVSTDEHTNTQSMTLIIYPHSRVRLDGLIPPKTREQISAENDKKWDRITKDVEEELEAEGKDLENSLVKNEKEERILKKMDEEYDDSPTSFLNKYEVSMVNISKLEDEPFDRKSPVINALTSEILKVFKEISQINSMFREQIATFSATMNKTTSNIFEQPSKLADFCAAVCAGESAELQDVLNSLNIEQRLEKSLVVLKKEIMNAELQQKISKDVENKIQKRQREYYLMEQLKGIKKELGIDDGRQKLIDTFKERVENLKLPEAVQKVFDDEINKLSTLETAMSEFSVTRNYLDWITQLPWGLYTKENYSIKNAKKILDEDHYGLKDVKDRILEFIAVGNLIGAVDGKIICFVGPPGVGKTSIGKSIARALNRNFFRFSVGGLSDVSEIKGHRRTYIGALPGRIIQALKKTQSSNPLILIDEIDKIGHTSSQGDPAAALLELLDPEQNGEFLDHYMDIPVDLSKVLFVCTANTLDTIPRPLLDRMEIIELPGYVVDEKIRIAEDYLIPAAKKTSGLEDAKVELDEAGVQTIVKHYAKENGVRKLKQLIEKVYRKAAFKVVSQISESLPEATEEVEEPKSVSKETVTESTEEVVPNVDHNKPLEDKKAVVAEESEVKKLKVPEDFELEITPKNLKDYIGPPIYLSDRLYDITPPGVVMGLAWTSIGGTSMYVESTGELATDDSGKGQGGHIAITGQLGDVMKESTKIAYSVAKQYVHTDYFKNHNVNLHCPEGAVPKDGPSAGITITTSLISLALGVELPLIAMTGEITLTGKVLRIGGLKEKLIAAKGNGVSTLFLPKANEGDYEVLPENIKKGLDVTFVENYSEIFQKLFGDVKNNVAPPKNEQKEAVV